MLLTRWCSQAVPQSQVKTRRSETKPRGAWPESRGKRATGTIWRPGELTHAVCGSDAESLLRTLECDGVLVTEAEGDRVRIVVVSTVYLWVTVGVSDDPGQSADPLGPARVQVPVAFVGTLADAVPESLVATFYWFMPHAERSSYDVATEDLAEVLLVGTPIPSAGSKALKGGGFRCWHSATRSLEAEETSVDCFMAPIEDPSRHGSDRSISCPCGKAWAAAMRTAAERIAEQLRLPVTPQCLSARRASAAAVARSCADGDADRAAAHGGRSETYELNAALQGELLLAGAGHRSSTLVIVNSRKALKVGRTSGLRSHGN